MPRGRAAGRGRALSGGGAGHDSGRRRSPQQMRGTAGPAPGSPAGQAQDVRWRTHAGEPLQRPKLHTCRRIDTDLDDPAPEMPAAEGEAHYRADREPSGPAVAVPGRGHRVVEQLVETDHIRQDPHRQRRAGACRRRHSPGGRSQQPRFLGRIMAAGRCRPGGWLLEREPALRLGAQKPRADFMSARRSVLSQLNSPSRAGRPKWP